VFRKRILLELSEEQESAVSNLAKRHKLNRVDILRLFCDLLIGEEDCINIIIHSNDSVKYASRLNNFKQIIDTRKDDSVSNIKLIFEHSIDARKKDLLDGDDLCLEK